MEHLSGNKKLALKALSISHKFKLNESENKKLAKIVKIMTQLSCKNKIG